MHEEFIPQFFFVFAGDNLKLMIKPEDSSCLPCKGNMRSNEISTIYSAEIGKDL